MGLGQMNCSIVLQCINRVEVEDLFAMHSM